MKLDLRDLDAVTLLTAWADAVRCCCVFEHPIALDRPDMCWRLLPLGMSVEATLAAASEHPPEPDAAAVHARCLAILEARRDHALGCWHAYNRPKGSIHVH